MKVFTEEELLYMINDLSNEVSEQEKRLEELESLLAYKNGLIDGLKFAIRCDGVSGAEVREEAIKEQEKDIRIKLLKPKEVDS